MIETSDTPCVKCGTHKVFFTFVLDPEATELGLTPVCVVCHTKRAKDADHG